MSPRHRYLAFWKPYGVVTQFTGEPPTLRDFIAVPEVYACGRLDKDSEGLLLLTSDGPLQHRLTNPRFKQPKTYWAQVEGIPTAEALARLRGGIELDGEKTSPARVRLLCETPAMPPREPPIRVRKSIPDRWIELILTEGRNRQVRRMTAAVGLPTLRLIRVAIGPIGLQGLTPGQWRDLSPAEAATLKR